MRRPWNLTNVPIYSLVTFDRKLNLNMNICTYVTPISLKPKKYLIAIDKQTKTFENILNGENKYALQILSQKNISIVKHLGKKSAHKFNKYYYLKRNKLIKNFRDVEILNDVSCVLFLSYENQIKTNNDHDLFLFNVSGFKTFSNTDILYFNDLVIKKIIL